MVVLGGTVWVRFVDGAVVDVAVVLDAVAFVLGVITEMSVLLGLLKSTDPFVASLLTGDSREPGNRSRGKNMIYFCFKT